MERKNSRYVFLKKTRLCWKHVFPDVFLDACLGFRFGILPPAGQRSQKKHAPGKKHAYIAQIRPYRPISAPYRPLFAPDPLIHSSHISPPNNALGFVVLSPHTSWCGDSDST